MLNLRLPILSALLGLTLSVSACDAPLAAPDRAFDAGSGALVASDLAGPGLLQVRTLSLRIDADSRQADYQIETSEGRRFLATVTQTLERDGDEEVIEVTDTQTGEVASWSFDDDVATQISPDGAVAIAELEDDGERSMITLPMEDGTELVIDFTGVEEGSEEEQERTALLGLALLGQAPLDSDQLGALAASLEAADEDLGAVDRGLGLKKLVQKVAAVFCTTTTKRICEALVVGGAIAYETVAGAVALVVGAACVTVHENVCK